jgi:hypoxanthine phosphoribosyltransferase
MGLVHRIESKLLPHWKRYRFYTTNETNVLIDKLIHSIKGSGYEPDIIVGILSGGESPSRALAEALNAPVTQIHVSHYTVQFAGLKFKDIVGIYRLASMMGKRPEVKVVSGVTDTDVAHKDVLLVDDDACSGWTLEKAIEHVQSSEPGDVRSAVLRAPTNLKNVNFAGEFYERKQGGTRRIVFPWKAYSPHYHEFMSKAA